MLDEENPLKDWSNLTEEERKKREEEETKKKEEEKKKSEEEVKKQADEFAKLDELGKIQATWRKKVEDTHNKSLDRLKLKRLTKAQKVELFKTIRYAYLHHEQLLAMTANPIFELAKNFIVEGLAFKLDPKTLKKDPQINVEPRVYYETPSKKKDEEKKEDNKLSNLFNQALNQKAKEGT